LPAACEVPARRDTGRRRLWLEGMKKQPEVHFATGGMALNPLFSAETVLREEHGRFSKSRLT
jgi:hypothetical protein